MNYKSGTTRLLASVRLSVRFSSVRLALAYRHTT